MRAESLNLAVGEETNDRYARQLVLRGSSPRTQQRCPTIHAELAQI